MTNEEIKAFLEKEEVIEFLKNNVQMSIEIEPCENIYGYNIEASAWLFGNLIAEDEDCI
jgi:hypothetical protein